MTWWWRMLLRNLSNTSNPSFTTTTGTLPTSLDVSNTFRFVSSWMESLSGELLNFFFLWLQLHLTDGFLNHKFAWWADLLILICLKGTAGTLWSSTWTAMQTERATAWVTTTPCALPSQQRCHCTSKVSHQLSFIGLLHGAQHRSCWRWTVSQRPLYSHTGACLPTLPLISAYSVQNIINEKIYLVLWFWYAFLVPVSFTFFFYRGFTILVYELRFNLLYKTVDLQLCFP